MPLVFDYRGTVESRTIWVDYELNIGALVFAPSFEPLIWSISWRIPPLNACWTLSCMLKFLTFKYFLKDNLSTQDKQKNPSKDLAYLEVPSTVPSPWQRIQEPRLTHFSFWKKLSASCIFFLIKFILSCSCFHVLDANRLR